MSDTDFSSIKVGDIVTYTSDKIVRRKWWQLWKPKFYSTGEKVTNEYLVIKGPYSHEHFTFAIMDKINGP